MWLTASHIRIRISLHATPFYKCMCLCVCWCSNCNTKLHLCFSSVHHRYPQPGILLLWLVYFAVVSARPALGGLIKNVNLAKTHSIHCGSETIVNYPLLCHIVVARWYPVARQLNALVFAMNFK